MTESIPILVRTLAFRADEELAEIEGVQARLEAGSSREGTVVGTSLVEFLERYLNAAGDRFWEPPEANTSETRD